MEEFSSAPAGFCQLLTVLRKGKLRILQCYLGGKKSGKWKHPVKPYWEGVRLGKTSLYPSKSAS